MQKHLCYDNYPVGSLKSGQQVNKQNEQMKQYAANLCLAAYASFPVLSQQISVEAVHIFKYILEFYRPIVTGKISLPDIRKTMHDAGLTEQYKHFIQYFSYFMYQGGNYEGFGDTKFIPRLSKEDFLKVQTVLHEKCGGHFGNLKMDDKVLEAMYDLSKYLNIQFYENKGQTQYYSASMTKDDVVTIDKALKEWNADFMLENTTIEETADAYLVKMASIQKKQAETGKVHKGKKIILDYGKFGEEFKVIVQHLQKAINFAANDTQKKMLGELIKFYETGEMEHHLEYSKLWVMDVNPAVETYQGFIETYRDPQGVRAEMEAFVAVIDLVTSGHLARLLSTETSSKVLSELPVPKFLHRETFQTPTYNAIDIVAFVASGMPIGINIPNYDKIRNGFGFKNVSLQNVINTRMSKSSSLQYVAEDLKKRIAPQMSAVMNNNTALHELFGHGSCRILYQKDHEQLTEDEKKEVSGHYQEGQAYMDVFGEISSQFEECRAQVTAEFLQDTQVCFEAFEIKKENEKDYRLAFTYDMVLVGLLGLMQYDDKTQKWLQAHSRANHLILRNVLNRTDAVKLDVKDNDISIIIDEDRINEVHDAHGWLINRLNVLKSGADYKGGLELFNAGTNVDDYWLKVRDICIANKKPRWVYIPALVKRDGDKYEMTDVQLTEEDEYAGPSYVWANNAIIAGL